MPAHRAKNIAMFITECTKTKIELDIFKAEVDMTWMLASTDKTLLVEWQVLLLNLWSNAIGYER